MSLIKPADVVGMRLNLNGSADAVKQMRCVNEPIGCGRMITQMEYMHWDPLTCKEYSQSGWCRDCQDKVFNDPEDPKPLKCTHEGDCEENGDESNCICSCNNPCCIVDIGVGNIDCGSQHCRVHGGTYVQPS